MFAQQFAAIAARRRASPVAAPPPVASPRVAEHADGSPAATPPVAAANVRTSPTATPRTSVQNLQAVARVLNRGPKDSNTNKAYAPKMAEYRAFCDSVYAPLRPSLRYTVNPDRLYLFMFYQGFREKKSQGGVNKGTSQGFDYADYLNVMQK